MGIPDMVLPCAESITSRCLLKHALSGMDEEFVRN